jgi:hypothetical protein
MIIKRKRSANNTAMENAIVCSCFPRYQSSQYHSDYAIGATTSRMESGSIRSPDQASAHTMFLQHEHEVLRTPPAPMLNLVKRPSPQRYGREGDHILTINMIPIEETNTNTHTKGDELSFQDDFLIPPIAVGICDLHALGPVSTATIGHHRPRLVPRQMSKQEAFRIHHFRPIFIDDEDSWLPSLTNNASNDAPSPCVLKGYVLAPVDSATASRILSPSASSRLLLTGPPRPDPCRHANKTVLPMIPMIGSCARDVVDSHGGTIAVDSSVPPSQRKAHSHMEAIPKFRLHRRRHRRRLNQHHQATAPRSTDLCLFHIA